MNNRFLKIAYDLSNKPIEPINKACEDWAHTKAAYRFFDNDKISTDNILKPHIEQTHKRISNYPFVLALQDTTSFNYTNHPKKKALAKSAMDQKKKMPLNQKDFTYIKPWQLHLMGNHLVFYRVFFGSEMKLLMKKLVKKKNQKDGVMLWLITKARIKGRAISLLSPIVNATLINFYSITIT